MALVYGVTDLRYAASIITWTKGAAGSAADGGQPELPARFDLH
jgi:hypothetical protein